MTLCRRLSPLALALVLAPPLAAAPPPSPFAGIEPHLLDSPAGTVTDLSGLALCHGRLLAVSDKNNDTIFAIELANGRARIAPALAIPPPPPKEASYHAPANVLYRLDAMHFAGRLDWEAIACHENAIYLLSERKNAVLKISGDRSEWLPIDWYGTLYEQGFLRRYNAYGEGIALAGEGEILIAIEREPRGILRLTRSEPNGWQMAATALSEDIRLTFRAGNPDIADIALHRGALFTLERNASSVCRRDRKTLRADSCFSYLAVEDDPRWRYADSHFGIGEGLTLDDEWLYIVFDNNDQVRLASANADSPDRRSLLLRMPMPSAWRFHK